MTGGPNPTATGDPAAERSAARARERPPAVPVVVAIVAAALFALPLGGLL